ncbi:lantibiotic dehydratase [Streptomyces phytohabitans]
MPHPVAREAERALTAMARITPYPHGSAAWQDYRSRFPERYSTGTVVPVRELTDPDTGLGLPVGYHGTVLPTGGTGRFRSCGTQGRRVRPRRGGSSTGPCPATRRRGSRRRAGRPRG